jgi:hypothetical protein
LNHGAIGDRVGKGNAQLDQVRTAALQCFDQRLCRYHVFSRKMDAGGIAAWPHGGTFQTLKQVWKVGAEALFSVLQNPVFVAGR